MVQYSARQLSLVSFLIVGLATDASAQQPRDTAKAFVLLPEAVWDGVADAPQRGWVVLVRGKRIEAAGPAGRVSAPADAERI